MRRRIFHVAIVALIAMSFASTAKCATFSYKSTPLRASVKTFLKENPEFSCATGKEYRVCKSERSTYGGFQANQIKAVFLENELSEVEVEFNELDIGSFLVVSKSISDGLTKKYGNPTEKTGPDAVFINAGIKIFTTKWIKNDDKLYLYTTERSDENPNGRFISIRLRVSDFSIKLERIYGTEIQRDM